MCVCKKPVGIKSIDIQCGCCVEIKGLAVHPQAQQHIVMAVKNIGHFTSVSVLSGFASIKAIVKAAVIFVYVKGSSARVTA